MRYSKIAAVLLILLLLGLFLYFDLHNQINLAWLKTQQINLDAYYEQNSLLVISIYVLAYVVLSSTPVAAILTLAGAAIFGLVSGTIIVSFASTLGASLAFILSRFLFHGTIQNRFDTQLETINKGIENEGAFYLFALRLVPLFPFFAINLVMGLTRMKLWTFAWVSQLGMLPGTIVYIYAGTQLAKIESTKDIFNPQLIIAFSLLGIFPLAMKKVLTACKSRGINP